MRHLRRAWHLGRLLLQRVYDRGKGCKLKAKKVRKAHEVTCAVAVQRDGCPKIVNLGAARTDLFYERKKYGFKPR